MITEYTSARAMEEDLLRNLLGGRASVERRNDGVERHPRAGDPDDAVGVGVDRHSFDSFGRIHVKHSDSIIRPASPLAR